MDGRAKDGKLVGIIAQDDAMDVAVADASKLMCRKAGGLTDIAPYGISAPTPLKRVAIFQIRSARFRSLFCRMS